MVAKEDRIPVTKDLEWTTPDMAEPGQVVLVHTLWSPDPKYGTDWLGPPEPPQDLILGEWVPVPRVYLGVTDRVFETCCAMVVGLVNLFQEDPDYCTISTLGREWKFPRTGLYQIAMTNDKSIHLPRPRR
jgi:hypothetical protein